MTTKEKNRIHELLSAYRISPAIHQLRLHLPPGQTELREKLATIEGRNEHFTRASRNDYTPIERRNENDELVKALQLILSKFEINDKPRTLADIIGRDLDEDFKEREADPVPTKPEHAEPENGFHGEVEYSGSPSAKRKTIDVDKSYGATYHRCTQALRGANVEIGKGDREGGRLSGTTAGNSHARFGELVEIWVTPQPKGRTSVELIVDSALKETVFDMGRNQKLLDQLSHKIKYG